MQAPSLPRVINEYLTHKSVLIDQDCAIYGSPRYLLHHFFTTISCCVNITWGGRKLDDDTIAKKFQWVENEWLRFTCNGNGVRVSLYKIYFCRLKSRWITAILQRSSVSTKLWLSNSITDVQTNQWRLFFAHVGISVCTHRNFVLLSTRRDHCLHGQIVIQRKESGDTMNMRITRYVLYIHESRIFCVVVWPQN